MVGLGTSMWWVTVETRDSNAGQVEEFLGSTLYSQSASVWTQEYKEKCCRVTCDGLAREKLCF